MRLCSDFQQEVQQGIDELKIVQIQGRTAKDIVEKLYADNKPFLQFKDVNGEKVVEKITSMPICRVCWFLESFRTARWVGRKCKGLGAMDSLAVQDVRPPSGWRKLIAQAVQMGWGTVLWEQRGNVVRRLHAHTVPSGMLCGGTRWQMDVPH